MSIPSFAKIYKYWKEECLLDPYHWEEQGQEKPLDSTLSLSLSLSSLLIPPSLSSPPPPFCFISFYLTSTVKYNAYCWLWHMDLITPLFIQRYLSITNHNTDTAQSCIRKKMNGIQFCSGFIAAHKIGAFVNQPADFEAKPEWVRQEAGRERWNFFFIF